MEGCGQADAEEQKDVQKMGIKSGKLKPKAEKLKKTIALKCQRSINKITKLNQILTKEHSKFPQKYSIIIPNHKIMSRLAMMKFWKI